MTAKLLDKKRRNEFEVLVLPNLYGDILTDEAAEIQGGVGTAGSANIGKKFSMFEAIHGSAPRMVEEGRDIYATLYAQKMFFLVTLQPRGAQFEVIPYMDARHHAEIHLSRCRRVDSTDKER